MKPPPELPAISNEFIYVNGILAFDPRSPDAAVDPTTLPVYMAFVPDQVDPGMSDWVTAAWESTTTARCQPNASAPLTKAFYTVWLRIDGGTETPKRPVGELQVI